MARPSHRTAAALGGVLFLTTLCTLLLEILLTRVLSVMMWYHFTFAVISVSLLGIAAGAMACHRRFGVGSKFDDDVLWRTLTAKLTLFSIAVAFPIVLMTRVIATPTFSVAGVVLLLGYFAACAAPFYASGYLTATIFRFGPGRVS